MVNRLSVRFDAKLHDFLIMHSPWAFHYLDRESSLTSLSMIHPIRMAIRSAFCFCRDIALSKTQSDLITRCALQLR